MNIILHTYTTHLLAAAPAVLLCEWEKSQLDGARQPYCRASAPYAGGPLEQHVRVPLLEGKVTVAESVTDSD